MSTDNNVAIGWDEERIDNPQELGEFVELPPGNYPFSVVGFKRDQYPGGDKMCACPMAIMTLEIDGGEFGPVKHTHKLYLNKKCVGLLCAFFSGIGLRKHGDPLILAWKDTVGRSGVCKLAQREHDGKKYNDIKGFVDPPDHPVHAPAQETGEIPF